MQIRTVKVDGTLDLGIFGDLQHGNISCDDDKASRFLQKITHKYPQVRWLCTGDYTDFMSPSNRAGYRASGLYADTLRAISFKALLPLVEEVAELMGPMTARIDAFCQGHHYGYYDWEAIDRHKRSEWLKVEEGTEIFEHSDRHLAYLLGALDTFTEYVRIVRYVWPTGAQYRVLVWHGTGSGQTLAYGLNRIVRSLGGWEGLNLVVMGHTHALGALFAGRSRIDDTEDELVEIPVGIVNSGSYLKAYTTDGTAYPEKGMLTPRGLGSPVVHVEPNDHGFDVEISLYSV